MLFVYTSNILVYFCLLMYYKNRHNYFQKNAFVRQSNHVGARRAKLNDSRSRLFSEDVPFDSIRKESYRNLNSRSSNPSNKVKKVGTLVKLKTQLTFVVTYPFAHLLIFSILLFFWIFRYTCFQSLVLLIWLANSLLFINSNLYFSMWKYLYIPILLAIHVFFYVINITNLIDEEYYDGKYLRYGMFKFENEYFDLLIHMCIFFYAWLVCKLYSMYTIENSKRIQKKASTVGKSTFAIQRKRIVSVATSQAVIELDRDIKLYEILLTNGLKYLDIVLLVCLYIAGTNRVDVFHIILLIYLTLFVVYPKFMRRNFVYFVSFVIVVVLIKYVYVLIAPEITSEYSLYKVMFVLGLINDFNEEDKYWKSALLNDNWLIVLLAVIQFQLYKSKLLGWIFLETTKDDEDLPGGLRNRNSAQKRKLYELTKSVTIFIRYPRLSRMLIYIFTLLSSLVPWAIYSVLMITSMVQDKTLMNFQFTTFTIIFIIFHWVSKLITPKSNLLIARVWSVFIVYSAISFLSILVFQILKMKILADDLDFFNTIVPSFIKKTVNLIGFENYSDLETIELALKLLPFVLNFTLGVYARRQMIDNYESQKNIEDRVDDIRNSTVLKPISEDESFEEIVFGTCFTFSFLVFKCRKFWWILDVVAHSFLYFATLAIFLLSVYWQMSLAMLVNIVIVSYNFFKISRNCQPTNLRSNFDETFEGQTIELDDALKVRKQELISTNSVLLHAKKQLCKTLLIFNSIWYLLLYLSSFVEELTEIYPSGKSASNYVIFFANYSGVYYSKETGIYKFWEQAVGYLIIIALLAIERRAQVWLKSRFG